MINYVKGDILQSKAQLIVHSVAPNDNFGQGLALSLREQWPAMYKDFRHFCQVSHPKSGDIWVWAGASGTRIAALLTQEAAYGHGEKPGKSSLPHVNHSLRALRQEIEKEGVTSVALPKLATGVGGLDWDDVKPLIENHLGDCGAAIEVYETYVAGEVA
ncbi:macro domain-containing protein [Porticoccus litoralis]|uniref:Macro domain-containing protein n=1 Tax=Porticoccus litoralis TaxID=434086 RepID=A0AAW8B256_9GAMM|nr:macro domain-containing protein [Porticoccus litoralis]MDP1519866.1 macro domain-containing protein [Porticoccus litoralis]